VVNEPLYADHLNIYHYQIVVFKYPGFHPPSKKALSRAYGIVKDEMRAEGTPARNEKLYPPFVDQLAVPNGAGENDDCILSCIMKQLGINTIIEMLAVGAGAPVIKKRFVTPGSSPRASIISKYIPETIPKHYRTLPRRVWAPTLVRPFALSKVTGRVIARWIPFAGWGLLAYDTVEIYHCVNRCNSQR